MSDSPFREQPEIVDVEVYRKRKSILMAAGVTLLLGLVPYSYMLLCGHYLLGGLFAAGHFAKRYQITISVLKGAQLGALGSILGMVVFFVALPLWLVPSITEEQWAEFTEAFVKDAYASGRPEVAEYAENFFRPENAGSMLVGLFIFLFVASAAWGTVGGMLGAVFFKKGPQAM